MRLHTGASIQRGGHNVAKKPVKKRQARVRAQKQSAEPTNQTGSAEATQVATPAQPGGLQALKQNLTGKRKAIFEILDDVKKVTPEQWQDPNQVEQLAKQFANKLGLPVPEQRIKQFVNAYKEATKNGPNANVDELVKKYGQNVDEKTLQEIKKFVPKVK
jgi:uncharacterized protein YpuA (DUF1002 family)